MDRNLKTVAQFAAESPFTPGQLRFWIFDAANNGLQQAGAVLRIGGRRVYLDVDKFNAWIDSQNPKAGRQ